MGQNLYIITGATSGLGLSIFEELSNNQRKNCENHIILISRNKNKLKENYLKYNSKKNKVEIHPIDLAKNSITKIENLFQELSWEGYSRTVLINNAGTILPIKQLHNLNDSEINNALRLNLIAPIVLTQQFMKYCNIYSKDSSVIINISSGVSKKPIEGWSLYCISKAAINMLSEAVAEESSRWLKPIKSLSINPGPLNTQMQGEIRKSDANESPIKIKFDKMYNNGELLDPRKIAKKIMDIIDSDNFSNGEFVDLNNL